MNQPTFLQSIERGFAQGVGTIVAYGLALLALSLFVGGQAKAATGSGATPTASGSCPSNYA